MATFRIIEGDAVVTVRGLPAASIDACVTDPPYELNFMGKGWDSAGVSFRPETWRAVYDSLKDGGRLLAFGGTRTYHRIVCAIEDAGFTIEDCIMWVYGSGFPKHKSKLKPAYEPVVVARKGRASHLNIDACRIPYEETNDPATNPLYRKLAGYKNGSASDAGSSSYSLKDGTGERNPDARGRWPANVILDEEAAQKLDEQSGTLKSGVLSAHHKCAEWGYSGGERKQPTLQDTYGDSGGASRFFYCAKVARGERHMGLVNPGPQLEYGTTLRKVERASLKGNNHPTVKPISLMQWLVRLVTPEGGTVLDPFCGSGSTGIAALREGFRFIGIEQDAEYCEIARRRIVGDSPMFNREESAA